MVRPERCPDCSGEIPIGARQLERKRARCPYCALDVQLLREQHGEGPGRESTYLSLRAPELKPSARLLVERNHARLAIREAPASRVQAAMYGLAVALGVLVVALFDVIPLLAAAVPFLGILAFGFAIASRERSRLQIVVDAGGVWVNGRRADPAQLDPGGELTEPELRWARDVVTARLAGDGDARERD